MRLLSPDQVLEAEAAALAELGLSESALIERAGLAAAALAQSRYGPLAGRGVAVLCGKGHNAADALVAARHLALAGARVQALPAFPEAQLAPETAAALAAARQAGVQWLAVGAALPKDTALILDGLVGTGARLPLQGELARLAALCDPAPAPVLALDLPSGVDAATGAASSPCVRADVTLSFIAAKTGLAVPPARERCGLLLADSLGCDAQAARLSLLSAVGPHEARALLPPRPLDAHKRQAELLVVAGSREYLGAALLCARGAYRGGAGLVRLALPANLALVAASALPEAVAVSLPANDHLGQGQLAALLELAANARAVVVGPGLGRRPETAALVQDLWRLLPLPAVFDADALAVLQPGQPEAGARVLTPHEGELKRLLGPKALDGGRATAALALAHAFGAVGLLKGPASLVAEPGGRLSLNLADTPALATAGTGDVLAGLIGALLAQGLAPYEAAALGAWLHGRAAQRWARSHAGRGLLASELADLIPLALAEAGA